MVAPRQQALFALTRVYCATELRKWTGLLSVMLVPTDGDHEYFD
jgi:hypothetical protein